jgi:carbon starvation protein CstA
MITFILSVVALIVGYALYGKFVEKIFGVDKNRPTPVTFLEDGVDFVPMPWCRIFLIQFLNIAGLGPIFGAIAGAMWGPVAFLWIVFGCIFGGAVHDYLSGMLSVRMSGISSPEIIGKYLGKGFKIFIRGFTIALMVLVGAVFIMGPAQILANLTKGFFNLTFWSIVIFIYYILATLLPIDKIIGRIYPIFGIALLFMALGISFALILQGYKIPELIPATFYNMNKNASHFPIFPMLFVTIACGAISGFHSTQSPMMARCIANEKYGRRVFYGAMVAEGIVALIWAAAAMSFFGGVEQLNNEMISNKGNAALVVNLISNTLLGKIGAVFAILGVVAAPITTGDTAFRSARLILADFMKIPQKRMRNRILISLPLFFVGFLLTQINFGIIWRYMAWSNQVLAAIMLWTLFIYMFKAKKFYWIVLIPAIFMTGVVTTYILIAPEGFQLQNNLSYTLGGIITVLITMFFIFKVRRDRNLHLL